MVDRKLFDGKSAPDLLEEFRATGSQAPFEEIVRRYAGMVFSVCLRVTKNSHDAEDATQAVFLALAVQGKTAKPIRYIGPWLQQVAHRLSLDIRRSKKRQKAREEKVGELMRSSNGNGNGNGHGNGKGCPSAAYAEDELKRVINDEINQLPSKYRLPLILHYFGGLTREEMAKELGVRPNTLGVRVYRGRELLGKRLAQRGMTLGSGALALALAGSISLRVNESLILSTCHAVAAATGGMGGGPSVGGGIFAAQIAGITRSITRGMLLAKIKVVAALVVAVGSAVAGGADVVWRMQPLDLRFSMPLDITTRLRDLFRSFIQPIQFSSATPSATLPDGDDDDTHFAAGNWHYGDPIADQHFLADAVTHMPSSAPPPPRIAVAAAGGSAQSTSVEQAAESGPAVADEASSSSSHAAAGAVGSSPAKPTSGSGLPQVRSLGGAPLTPSRPPALAPTPPPAVAARPDVVLGAAAGAARETRIVEAGESHVWRSLTVGERGPATFRQTGGSTRIDTDLTVARDGGSTGLIELSGGTITTAGNQYIGLRGEGKVVQNGGANVIGGSLFVGFEGVGSYAMTGGTLSGDTISVAYSGEGHFSQTFSEADAAGSSTAGGLPATRFDSVTIADRAGSHGVINLSGGEFNSVNQVIGRAGDGSVVQDGGTNTAFSIWLGSNRQSIGSYVLSGGVLRLDPNAGTIDGDAGITVGGAGAGSFRMGDANNAAKIVEAQAGTNLAVRAKESGTGLFSGWGSVGLSGLVVNNGRIVADGYGNDRELDLSTAAGVTNTIENPTLAGTNGWFADRGGALVLPGLSVATGSHAYSWGEDPNDALPDLVNSVRLYVRDAQGPGEINISLLALDRTDIPALPGGHNFIGVWSFDAGDLEFEGVDLAVRYDDALAQQKGLSEAVLKLWKYEDGSWIRISDDSFHRYSALNILSGYAGSELTYFAVSAPEPSSLGAIALGGWLLLRRRRR